MLSFTKLTQIRNEQGQGVFSKQVQKSQGHKF